MVIVYSDWGTMRQLLGRVYIGVNGSIGLYYRKHKIHTWINRSRKVTKTLLVDFVLFVSVITYVMVMPRKVVLMQTRVVMKYRV